MALAVLGMLVCGVVGMVVGLVRHSIWLSLLLVVAFALALLWEIAMRLWEANQLRGLWLAAAIGAGILAAVAFRDGWEAIVFLLLFLAIWHLEGIERPSDA
jgi:uncharacterized membrane protein (UPF0136 family)